MKHREEIIKGRPLYHSEHCADGKFKLAGFYDLPYLNERIWTYRCTCGEWSFGLPRKEGK